MRKVGATSSVKRTRRNFVRYIKRKKKNVHRPELSFRSAINHYTVSRFIFGFVKKLRAQREINFQSYRELLNRKEFTDKKIWHEKKKERERKKKERSILSVYFWAAQLWINYVFAEGSSHARQDAFINTPTDRLITFHKFSRGEGAIQATVE